MTKMKRLFLTGIAALFLATGTAHAYPARYYDCGRAFVKIQTFHGSAPSRRVFPTVWTISEKGDGKHPDDLGDRALNFRCAKPSMVTQGDKDKCWLNGKFCRKMSDKEGQKEFSDDD
jgi:hypothetical protein